MCGVTATDSPQSREGRYSGDAMSQVMNQVDPRGHVSVAHVSDAWYPVALSRELKSGPLPARLLGVPLVLFRDEEGTAKVMLDRCPHRNVPLSRGTVRDGQLQCGYHGWRFDGTGALRALPGAPQELARSVPARCATVFESIEQDGLIWVWGNRERDAVGEPFAFRFSRRPGYTTVREAMDVEASVHATVENALDVPHTAFLHGGLFRSEGGNQSIDVIVRAYADRVEAEYVGESRPKGLVGRFLAPGGGEVTHFDRFYLPSIVEVEYQLGGHHFISSGAICPMDDFSSRMFAVVSFKLPVPAAVVVPVLRPLVRRIFAQDAKMLKAQTDTIRHFGTERYASSSADVLGGEVWRMLREAERRAGRDPEPRSDAPLREHRLTLTL